MEPAGVYVHIPFCTAKCDYCAFHSVRTTSVRDQQRIVSKIIEDAAALLSELEYLPSTIYVGGGTPSTLEPGLLSSLVNGIRDIATELASPTDRSLKEISVEANPASATSEFLEEAEKAEVSRLSVGVQTLDRGLSRMIGRPAASLVDIERIRATWSRSLGADLIVGIPGQRTGHVLADLNRLIALGVEHFSLYELSVEPGTPLARRVAQDARHGESAPDWTIICDHLAESGFHRYEVSNFALPGHASEHNLGYWRSLPYIGLGPSATSTVRTQGEVVRLVRTSDHEAFLETGPFSGSTSEHLTMAEQMREFVMLGLRTSEGVNPKDFQRRFSTELLDHLGPAVAELVGQGYLVLDDETLRPTPIGMDLLNRVLLRLP